ncbi:hypothetical protein J6590_001776 [Homalodisca vitripennis]|nr:hypothetical protein J6590_001776 [Homalodisca vitripennis]
MAHLCVGCSSSYLEAIRKDEYGVLQFYVNHGAYNQTRRCGNRKCGNELVVNEFGDFSFRCGKYYNEHVVNLDKYIKASWRRRCLKRWYCKVMGSLL